MKISLRWLVEKGACEEARKAHEKKWGTGDVEYQDVLNALAEKDRADWASWLMNAAGPTKDILKIDGDLVKETSIFFCGTIKVTGRIAAKFIFSGEGIKAGSDIEAGWGIKAGSGIEAGSDIKAGSDWGIYAGIGLRVSLKSKHAIVISKNKPKNLICGEYREVSK